jgi:hypothetical protein
MTYFNNPLKKMSDENANMAVQIVARIAVLGFVYMIGKNRGKLIINIIPRDAMQSVEQISLRK